MSTVSLRFRTALVLPFFFPWFPSISSSPTGYQPPAAMGEARAAGESQPVASVPEEPLVLPGVVIEEIPKGSALEKAGLQVGDVILSWERLPNPPANPEGAQGELISYFDWLELEMEQAPRGVVVLSGRRGGESLELPAKPEFWAAKVRPRFSRALEVIYLIGENQLASGDLEAAVSTWRSLADGLVGESDAILRAWIALHVGQAWGEKGNWKRAVEATRKALEATESPSIQFAAWEALGDAHERLEEYQVAERAYSSALAVRLVLYPKGSLGEAIILDKLGAEAMALGELDRARDYLLRSAQTREQLAPQSLQLAESLNDLGVEALMRGQLDQADGYLLRALRIREKAAQPLDLAVTLNNLGSSARASGELDKAQEYHLMALQIREKLGSELEVANSLTNLGALAMDKGEFDHAQDYFLRALRLKENQGSDGFDVARSLNNLGVVALARGESDRAGAFFLRALRIQEKLAPQSLAVAVSLGNLGTVARASGDLVGAESYFLRGLRIEERLAPDSLDLAVSLSNLGTVAQARGNLDRAHGYYLRALRLQKKLAPQSLDVAFSLRLLGTIAQARGDLKLARRYYLETLRLEEELTPKSLDMAEVLNDLGSLALSNRDLVGARDFFNKALEALEHQVSMLGSSYSVQTDFRAQHDAYYHSMLELLFVQGRFREAFHVLERLRAQTFLTMLAERDTAFTADIPEELDRERRRLGVQYDLTLKQLAGLNPRDHSKEIEATRRELQRLESEAGDIEASIRRASPRLAALQYPKPLDTAEAQQALDPGTLLLSYSVGKKKTALFAIFPSGDLEIKILPLGEAALRSQVKQLLSLIREAVQGSSLGALREHRVQAASRELYKKLLAPVAERIAASDRLLILPDGPLHTLPFGALLRDIGAGPDSGGGQYLAEWKPLHVALSATVFAELKQRRHPASENVSQTPIQIAAFGDPIYPQSLTKSKGVAVAALSASTGAIAQVDAPRADPIVRSAAERGIFDWPPLPYTRHEVEGIAHLFPDGTARTFLGPEALEERIKSLDPKTRILHLAAHGYTDEHLPSSSFVALTIPEDTSSDAASPERDNGLLQVWEIFEKVRLDADLVVLSACDTGLGEEQGGEGLIGLTRAFQYAGARTVMASLWSVEDQATSELMIRFYKHLRAGLTKDEALRQAQIELIRGPIEVVNEKGEKTLIDASAPYFWAGFQIYGDWQ